MKRRRNKTLTDRLFIHPALRLYRRLLERQIEKEIEAKTFTRELSMRVDAINVLLEQ